MKRIFIVILIFISAICLAKTEGINTVINKAPEWAVNEDPNVKEIKRILNWANSIKIGNEKNEEKLETFVDNYRVCNYYKGRLDGRVEFLRTLKQFIRKQIMESENSIKIEDYDTHSMVVQKPSLQKDKFKVVANLYDNYVNASNVLGKKIFTIISYRTTSYIKKYHVSYANEKINKIAMQNLYAYNEGKHDVGSISEKELKEKNFISGFLTPFINISKRQDIPHSPASAGIALASIITKSLEDYIKTTDMYDKKNLNELLGKWYKNDKTWIFGIYKDHFRTGNKCYNYDEIVKISDSFFIVKIENLGEKRKYFFRNLKDESMEYSKDCVNFTRLNKK